MGGWQWPVLHMQTAGSQGAALHSCRRRSNALPPTHPPQAVILQGQVKAQADKDVGNYEAEWRQLTDLVEQDRRAREAQRAHEIAAREQQMAALFKQEFNAGGRRRGSGREAGAGTEGGKPGGSAAGVAAIAPERVRQLKEAFARLLEATGAGRGQAAQQHAPSAGQKPWF